MDTANTIAKRVYKKNRIPSFLIYEELDGIPIYYQGYKEVVKKKKTLEDIMGSSTLQSLIVGCILRILYNNLDERTYHIATNEIGIHISPNSNISNDIAIFEKSLLTPEHINTNYATVAPKLVIEVDTKADLSEIKYYEYVHKKTQKLLDFGIDKVIWIFTKTQKVMTAENEENWQTMSWYKEIGLIEALSCNIGQYLDEQGIKVE